MMGYADPNQVGSGLRQRLYSRAFIIGSPDNATDRFVYLVLDTQSGDTAVRYGILDGLAKLGPEYSMYTQNNVAVTGTHSHSGPGAWLNYLLPQITSKGFDKQSYQAIVDGTLLSIQRAHERLTPGHLTVGSIDVPDANINRSPYAYLANPEPERSQYAHDVDKSMTLLRLTRASDEKDIGILTWFPVHGTSMLGNNTLISGDNKGVAAYLFEKSVLNHSSASDEFIAGFSQSNVGDTSPNIQGAFCEDGSNLPCNFQDSTCSGKTGPCHGRGPHPGLNDSGARSCFEIGRRQYLAAKHLYTHLPTLGQRLPYAAPVRAIHHFVDFTSHTFPNPHNTSELLTTCPAALGYSFAAGTTDGPGAFDFKQNNSGDPNANPLWTAVRGFLHEPSASQKACHYPKPILLDVGEVTRPYLWTPNIVDIQLLRVGPLLIIVSPGEATTMAGRRWKAAITQAAVSTLEIEKPIVVLGGPANSYTHYIATREEYAVQRYEGASTLYGPHTLAAYINVSVDLLPWLHNSTAPSSPSGPLPPNNVNASLSFINPVVFDAHLPFRSFGDLLTDFTHAPKNGRGRKLGIGARFVGANPRNNLRLEGTFAAVEKRLDRGAGRGKEWEVVRTDADWDLIFRWERTSSVLGTSEVELYWDLEAAREIGVVEGEFCSVMGESVILANDLGGVVAGTYRLKYYGDAKSVAGTITAFEGVSWEFRLFE